MADIPIPEPFDMDAVFEAQKNRGCYVQCMLCWAGAHEKCDNVDCRCQASEGVHPDLVERMVKVNKYEGGTDG